MSEENVAAVYRIYEAINRVGPSQMLALPDETRRELFAGSFDPDVEVRQSTDFFIDTAETFHGYEGFLEATRELLEAFAEVRFDVTRTVEAGERVVCEVGASTRGRESGVPIQSPLFAHLWELRNGLVCRWIVYTSLDDALAAAGLPE